MKILQLNKEQKTAAEYDGGHVLVLAGAGTGKTRTIIARTIHLIRSSVKPKRILLMTFTRRAAKAMIERLKLYVGEQSNSIMAGTFHHFCLRTMRRMPAQFDIEGYTVIDRDDQEQLMKLVRAPWVEKGKQFPKASRLVTIYSYARNTNKSIKEYLDKFIEFEDETKKKVLKIFRAYDDRKRINKYLDFDDLLIRCAKVLHSNASVRNKIKSYYDHILVDEMQDTNPLQWLILDALRDPPKLFCVGDDAQSIYAFRGADFKNVHSFEKRLPNSVTLKLEENFRSTQETLDLSNWLLGQSKLTYGKELRAFRGQGIIPKLLDFVDDNEEADWIADDILERHEGGDKWRDHMILTRTTYASRMLEGLMIEKKIPYVFIGGTSLLRAAHVKDLLSLVRSALYQYDELAWMRYLTLWPKIGDVTAARIINDVKRLKTIDHCVDHLKNSFPDKSDLANGIRQVFKNRINPEKAIVMAVSFIEPLIENRYENWDIRKNDLQLMKRLAQNHKTLEHYLETYTMDPVHSSLVSRTTDEDKVTLITVHSAKGTEAKTCYIIKAEPWMYPHARSIGDPDQEEEERRILYVAMTRTIDELNITRVLRRYGSRVWYGSVEGSDSQGETPYFLYDVPEKLIDYEIKQEGVFDDDEVIIPWNK